MKFKSEVQLEALNNATIDTDKFLVSDGSTVKYRTGAQLLSDIGGITSLNGLTATIQTLIVGDEGPDFDIISNGIDQHIFNLPDASSLSRGVVTTGAQGFAGAKVFYEDLIVNGLTVGEGGAIGSTGLNNIAIGINALNVNNASNNTAIGNYSLRVNQDGFQNIAIGTESLWDNISGDYNTAIGYQALRANTANNNTAIGAGALRNNTVGFQNTAIGTDALLSNIDGEENTAIGKDALRSNIDANWNTAIGNSALQNNTIGYQNTAFGRFACLSNISGNYNMAIGVDALRANTISNYNTAIGHKAGHTITGFQNTFIGGQDDLDPSLQLVTVNNSIAIGYNAYTTQNNQVVLGSDLITETLLRGNIKLATAPSTSAGTYQILTINTVGGPNTGRIESVPSSSLNFLPLVGGNMTGNIDWPAQNGNGLNWSNDTDAASIKFYSTGDLGVDNRLEFNISDNNTEYFRWTSTPNPSNVLYEIMRLAPTTGGVRNAILTVSGKVIANSFEKVGGGSTELLAANGNSIVAGTNITIANGEISSVGGSGGSSVNFYLNGSIASSVAGYQQIGSTAIIGGGTDFTLAGNGTIAQFITNVGSPNRLEIPAGAWAFELWLQSSLVNSATNVYVELYKYNGAFTLIASSSSNPINLQTNTNTNLYITNLAIPQTTLLATDRFAVRVIAINSLGGHSVTLHTEDGNLCEILTNFVGGIVSINGLIQPTQTLAPGTTGSDFGILSSGSTHTFNLPDAGATARGVVTTGGQTFAGSKTFTNVVVINSTTTGVSATGTNIGVSGTSTNGKGVEGTSTNGIGVYGTSSSDVGVYGFSSTNLGVYGISTSNVGSYGESNSAQAGVFNIPTFNTSNIVEFKKNNIIQSAIQNNGKITATAGTASTDVVVKSQLDLKANDTYKVYTALLTQTGTTAPTATVLENTIGSIVWSRSGIGQYLATLTGAFVLSKTWGVSEDQAANPSSSTRLRPTGSLNSMQVVTAVGSTTTDGLLITTPIEIRVYN